MPSSRDNPIAPLAEVVESGLPIAPGLRAAAEELAGSRRGQQTATTLRQIADRLDAGTSLDVALESLAATIPAPLYGIVHAGLRSGRLDESLAWFVERRQRARRWRRQLLSAVAYPLVLLAVAVLLFGFFSTFVIPDFVKLFVEGFDAALPATTRALFAVSRLFWQFVIGAFTVGGLLLGITRWIGGRPALFRLLHRIPLLGRVLFYHGASEFAGALGLLIRQKIALPEALRLTADVMHDAAIGSACRSLAIDVESGRSLSDALHQPKQILAALAPIVAWGQCSGTLNQALQTLDDTYTGWAKIQAQLIETVLPPFVILLILGGIYFIVSGLLGPLIQVIQTLS